MAAKLTFYEKLYLPEIAKGLVITGRHFFSNLLVHTLNKVGLPVSEEPMVTISYPEVKRDIVWRARTRHRLTKHPDGDPKCVACMMCATACPADCIYIEAKEHPNPEIEKAAASFDIDISKCIHCGFCVEACPKDAIRMDTNVVEMAHFDRRALIYDMEFLLNEDPYALPKGAVAVGGKRS